MKGREEGRGCMYVCMYVRMGGKEEEEDYYYKGERAVLLKIPENPPVFLSYLILYIIIHSPFCLPYCKVSKLS